MYIYIYIYNKKKYIFSNFLPMTGKIIKSHSFHQQRQIFVTKRQQFVLDQVKYSQGFFTVSFLSSTQTSTLPKNIFPINPQALCYSLPSSSCSHRKKHSTAGRKKQGERAHSTKSLVYKGPEAEQQSFKSSGLNF